VVVVNSIKGIAIWLNQNNTGTFVQAHPYFGSASVRLKLFDADQDNDYDIISSTKENGNTLWLNEGNINFTSIEAVFGKTSVIAIGCEDLDGDEDLDVVFGYTEGSGGNTIYFNESEIVDFE